MKYQRIREVRKPEVGSPGSAGIDFFIPDGDKKIHCPVFEVVRVPLGIKVVIPKGKVMLMQDKSGVANALGLHVVAGVIDSDYRGEIHACFVNTSTSGVWLKPGDKIIQGIIVDYYNEMEEVNEKGFEMAAADWGVSTRGSAGFGSGTASTYRAGGNVY